jgi:hypothetical protein
MAISKKLVDMLQADLDKVPVPANYEALREKLRKLQPATRVAPTVKESP